MFKPILLMIFFITSWSAMALNYVPGEYIVGLKKGKSIPKFRKSSGISSYLTITPADRSIIKIVMDRKKSQTENINELKSYDEFRFVEPNYIWSKHTTDPKYDVLWGLKNAGANEPDGQGQPNGKAGVIGADINAEKAWEITKGSRDVKVAVIDTGVDYNHPDLSTNIWINMAEKNGTPGVDDDGNGYIDDIHGYDFINGDGDPMDDNGHGTHCAGTIAALHDNGEGVAGVMANATIVAIKFLSGSGSGTTEGAIKSVDYATSLNVDIMSNSWGGGEFSQALQEAIERAKKAGILFVAAAGNSSENTDRNPHYPSSYNLDNVIAVAAHTHKDGLATFSSYGKRSVHVTAPGHNILSTVIDGKYDVFSGTSMATPHVSGALGLLLSHLGRQNVATVRNRLIATSIPGRAYRRKVVGGGRLDAYNLLNDIRPQRPIEPGPNEWIRYELDEVFESTHPYSESQTLQRDYTITGAKHIRAVVDKFAIEKRYDFLKIIQPDSGEVVEKVDGDGENYASEYVDGDHLRLEFKSDSLVNEWGFRIKFLEYVPEN